MFVKPSRKGYLPGSLFLSGIEAHNATVTATDASFSHGNFRPIKPRKSRKKPPKTSDVGYESDKDDCDEMNEGDAKTSSPKLFACPNEGCIRVYKRYGSMVNHVAYGKCEFQPERESLLDTAKLMYSKKLWGDELSLKMGITGSAAALVPLANAQKKEEEEGWALRATKKEKTFSEKQRKFLEEKFMVGETGKKLDPVTVARQMKLLEMLMVRDNSHTKRFCLPRKFKVSFYGRQNAKTQKPMQSVFDKDYEAAENKEAVATLRNEVLEHIQPKHPVMYDGYNLCDLVTSQRLSKLKISKLSEFVARLNWKCLLNKENGKLRAIKKV